MAIVEGPALPPLESMTWVGDYARAAADQFPEQTAFVVPELGVSYTYAELDRRVGRAAALLRSRGLGRGDRIAHYGRNNDHYYVLLLAAIRLGLVVVPLNWRCVGPEIAFFLRDSQSRLLFCDAEFLGIAEAAGEGLDPAPAIILMERTDTLDGLRQFLEAEGEIHNEAIAWDADTVCLQLYTSGTTGRPKGVLIRHQGLSISRYQEQSWPAFPNWQAGTIVAAMPNFHIGGISWILMGLLRQSTCVMTQDPSATNITRLLVEHRAERLFAVPTVVRGVIDRIRAAGTQMPWFEGLFYGAAPMSPSLLADVIDTLRCSFGQFFGMTEITGMITFLLPTDHDPARPHLLDSVGRPYPGVAMEIRDARGEPVAPETPGEIWVRTPTVMQGYWQRPDATSEVLRDGWYRSGDGGYVDADGYLFLTDRIKDVIVSGGENVYPNEVEEVLRRFPDVLEVAIVGIPHQRWGEAVAAVVECRPGATIDQAELMAYCRTQIAPFKCPKHVKFVDALPRTASGKVQRAIVRKELLGSGV